MTAFRVEQDPRAAPADEEEAVLPVVLVGRHSIVSAERHPSRSPPKQRRRGGHALAQLVDLDPSATQREQQER